jgi:hypothetical protein
MNELFFPDCKWVNFNWFFESVEMISLKLNPSVQVSFQMHSEVWSSERIHKVWGWLSLE